MQGWREVGIEGCREVGMQEALQWNYKSTMQLCVKLICISVVLWWFGLVFCWFHRLSEIF